MGNANYREELMQQKTIYAPNQSAQKTTQPPKQDTFQNLLDDDARIGGGYWVVFLCALVGALALTIFRKAFTKAVKKQVRKWVLDEESSTSIPTKHE